MALLPGQFCAQSALATLIENSKYSSFSAAKNTNLINLLARQILVAGESFTMPSPCGANCSYTMSFEGPYMKCTTSSSILHYDDATGIFNAYTGQWFSPIDAVHDTRHSHNGTYTRSIYNATTLNGIQVNGSLLDGNGNSSALVQEDSIACTPGRAHFTVAYNYTNNIMSRNVSSQPVDSLINLIVPTHENIVIVPGFPAPNGTALGTVPANWSSFALNYYRDNNIMAIHGAVSSWLNGSFQTFFADGQNRPVTGESTAGTPFPSYLPLWEEQIKLTSDGQAVSISGTCLATSSLFMAIANLSQPKTEL